MGVKKKCFSPSWIRATEHRLYVILARSDALYFPIFCALPLDAVNGVNFLSKCVFLRSSIQQGGQVIGTYSVTDVKANINGSQILQT